MSTNEYILALDQGTTSSRAIVFDRQANIIAQAQQEFPQHYPQNGWVEHDPEDIWHSMLSVAREAFRKAEDTGGRVVAIGICNQRETSLVWDKRDGKAIHPAIVWQDRRTADQCKALKESGAEEKVRQKTGLLLDPYFSATKISWMLDNVDGARTKAAAGELAFGTVDTFLIYRLSGGKHFFTDATNASRTSLLNIHTLEWDQELLELFNVPVQILPEVKQCADEFGHSDAAIFGREIPILGVAGDQQAAAFGQSCFETGDTKSTYGTGCFVLTNTGKNAVLSQNRLLTTVAYALNDETSYAIEGSIFIAGAAMQWLRDELRLVESAAQSEALAASLKDNRGVYLVPAFTGLGAPHWEAEARGALFGLTRSSGQKEIVRATLESVVYQTYDLFSAMKADGIAPKIVRVDGGMTVNNWVMQFLADILDLPVERPKITETTALGAMFLAGLKGGWYKNLDDIRQCWQQDKSFLPEMSIEVRQQNLLGWQDAVRRVLPNY